MNDIVYPYRPKPLTMLLAGLFFTVCTPFIVQSALTNDRGLIINGIIQLDVGQATIFFWGLSLCGVVLSLGGYAGFVRGLTSHHQLVLGEHAFRMPKSNFSNQIITVGYGEITDMQRYRIKSQHFLKVKMGSRKVEISSGMLPNHTAFEAVCQTIVNRTNMARSAPLGGRVDLL